MMRIRNIRVERKIIRKESNTEKTRVWREGSERREIYDSAMMEERSRRVGIEQGK